MRTSYDGINACSQMDATTDETIDTDVSFCTYSGSFVHVYNMFVGEKEVVQFTGGPMLILSPIFSFLVVVLFFNIMIAIVHRAYVELGSREEDLFWSRRLDFLTELNNCVDSIRNKVSGVCCSKPQIEEQYHTTKDDYSIESDLDGSVRSFRKSGTSIDAKRTNSLNHSWDVLYSSFSHQTVSKEWEVKERRLYDKGGAVHRKILETPLLFRRIIAMCIFPIWILLGVLTLGLLWPTQIRELLFGAPLSRNDYRQIKQNTRERNVVNDQVMSMNERMQKMQDEVTGLKNDIGNMRLEIISEMNSFKQILLTSSAPRGTLYNPHTPQTPKTSHTMAQSPYYYHPYASQATNTSQYAPQSPHQYHPYNSTPRSGPSIISQSNTKTAASPPFQI